MALLENVAAHLKTSASQEGWGAFSRSHCRGVVAGYPGEHPSRPLLRIRDSLLFSHLKIRRALLEVGHLEKAIRPPQDTLMSP